MQQSHDLSCIYGIAIYSLSLFIIDIYIAWYSYHMLSEKFTSSMCSPSNWGRARGDAEEKVGRATEATGGVHDYHAALPGKVFSGSVQFLEHPGCAVCKTSSHTFKPHRGGVDLATICSAHSISTGVTWEIFLRLHSVLNLTSIRASFLSSN